VVVIADEIAVAIEEKSGVAGHASSQTKPPPIAREWKGGLTEGAGGVEPTLIPA
jgi:hypothetical protein